MIQSMTAFSRHTQQQEWGSAIWEIRSVNSRYLETNFRLPESFKYLEFQLRDKLRKTIHRGKLDCTLKYEVASGATDDLTINQPLASALIQSHKELQKLSKLEQQPDLTELLKWPGIVKSIDLDNEKIAKDLAHGFASAIEQVIEMRQTEGRSLAKLISKRLEAISHQVQLVRECIPQILKWQSEKILARFEEVKLEFDQSRVEQEMVLITHKTDVDEEMDRLDTHVKEVYRLLANGGVVGRRLDFLMQELNREANTLGSKSISSETTAASVELKVLIEQMREQIQNIE